MGSYGGRPKGGSYKKSIDYNKPKAELNIEKSESDNDENPISDNIRDAIQNMLTDNTINLSTWLTAIGDQDPQKALALFKDFAEYVVPKQQRTDNKADNQQPVVVNFLRSSDLKAQEAKQTETVTLKPSILDDLFRTN